MDKNMEVVKIKKNEKTITDEYIYNLAFLVNIKNNSNLMSFFTLPKYQPDLLKNSNRQKMLELIGETFPKERAITTLQQVYFLRNSESNPCLGFRIHKQNSDEYLVINYNTGKFNFKKSSSIDEELYKFTFFFIPYFCPSVIDSNYFSRGSPCLWRTNI